MPAMAEIHVINVHETKAQREGEAEGDRAGHSPYGAFSGRWEVEGPCTDEDDGVEDHDRAAVELGTEGMGRKIVAGNTIFSVACEEAFATFSTQEKGSKGFGGNF